MTGSLPTTPPVSINYYWSLTLIWTLSSFAPTSTPMLNTFASTSTSNSSNSTLLSIDYYQCLIEIPNPNIYSFTPQSVWHSVFLLAHVPSFFFFFYKIESCYFHNIFTTNYKQLVVIGLNLNLTLRLLFCPNNNNRNNLPLRIYCKNVADILFSNFFMLIWQCGAVNFGWI